MSEIRRRSRALAYVMSLVVLLAGVWLPWQPTTALAQLSPGGSSFNGGTITSSLTISGAQLLVNSSWNINAGGDLVGYGTGPGAKLGFNGASSAALSATAETYFTRLAAGVFGTNLWVQNTGGRSFLAADYTNATTGFTNTALSITVLSGRKYSFTTTLFVTDSTAADGAKLDFNGGSAAATSFIATCVLTNAVGAPLTQVAATTVALATPLNIAALTDTNVHQYVCTGGFVPSGAGTFIIRAAQNAHTTGTLTVKLNSWLAFEDNP